MPRRLRPTSRARHHRRHRHRRPQQRNHQELEQVYLPPAAVVPAVPRSGLGDIELGTAELVDHVPRVRWRARTGQVCRRAHRPIHLTIHIERRTTDTSRYRCRTQTHRNNSRTDTNQRRLDKTTASYPPHVFLLGCNRRAARQLQPSQHRTSPSNPYEPMTRPLLARGANPVRSPITPPVAYLDEADQRPACGASGNAARGTAARTPRRRARRAARRHAGKRRAARRSRGWPAR